jgi:hypothetical protein
MRRSLPASLFLLMLVSAASLPAGVAAQDFTLLKWGNATTTGPVVHIPSVDVIVTNLNVELNLVQMFSAFNASTGESLWWIYLGAASATAWTPSKRAVVRWCSSSCVTSPSSAWIPSTVRSCGT